MRSLQSTLLIFITLNASWQNLDCERFENGKFKIFNTKHGNTIIERNGSEQIEYNEPLTLKLKFSVKWVSDCKYTLKLEEIVENSKEFNIPQNLIFTVEIIRTKADSYIQKTSSNYSEIVTRSEVFRIE